MILVVSPPRSGSSLVTNLLKENGVYVGVCKEADENNKDGYFENVAIQKHLSELMRSIDAENLGKKFQPINYTFANEHIHHLRQVVGKEFYGVHNYAIKNVKIALTWQLWIEAFPSAKVLILNRSRTEILKSIQKSPFMDQYTTEDEWNKYLDAYYENMAWMEKSCDCLQVNLSNIIAQDNDELFNMSAFCGMELSYKGVIKKELWNRQR